MVGGRPSDYTPEIAAEFCRRIAEGRMVRDVCRDADMPSSATFYHWLDADSEFLKQYLRAKEIQSDSIVAEALEIADTKEADNVCDEYGNIKPNHEWIKRSELRVKTRQWIAARISPRKYGDKVEQTVIGDPERPVNHKHDVDVRGMTEEQLKGYIRDMTHGSG